MKLHWLSEQGEEGASPNLERAVAQLMGWLQAWGEAGHAGDMAVRAETHLLRHTSQDREEDAETARSLLALALSRGLPPTLSAHAQLGEVFLLASQTLGDRRYIEVVHSVCDGLLQWPRDEREHDCVLSSSPGRMLPVHHANLQAAALLARAGYREQRQDWLELALRASRYSCLRQLPDGSWLHGQTPLFAWVDDFHAPSLVASLLPLAELDPEGPAALALPAALERLVGLHFDGDGRPRVHARGEGVGACDVLAAAEVVDALVRLAALHPRVGALAETLASWMAAHLQPWEPWQDLPSPHSPARIVRALVRVQSLAETFEELA